MALMERFLAKVDQTGDCWIWTSPSKTNGYGLFWFEGRMAKAHCVSYSLFIGAIPAGSELDHLCHAKDLACAGGNTCPHRACVRPDHLEPVTHLVNTYRSRSFASVNAAKTHCPQGHPYDTENTYVNPRGRRICRICKAASKTASRTKAKMQAGSH
jgi:hypothetical protein